MQPPDLSVETLVWGNRTHVVQVRAEHCEALAARRIAHVAVTDAAAPYTVVRTHLSGAYMQVCLGGEGHTLLDGRWYKHKPGYATFAPAHVLHAFHCLPGSRWQLVWVRFMPDSPRSIEGVLSPMMTRFDGRALQNAVLGLSHEQTTLNDPASCAMWVDLIERYSAKVLEPGQFEPRLAAVWRAVQADPGRDWTLADLARLANTSEEHLRRLCQRQLGRSPGKQLASIRMARAARLLSTTRQKVETIAASVGYANPFAFSNTFKRITGFRPSDYRTRPQHDDRASEPVDVSRPR